MYVVIDYDAPAVLHKHSDARVAADLAYLSVPDSTRRVGIVPAGDVTDLHAMHGGAVQSLWYSLFGRMPSDDDRGYMLAGIHLALRALHPQEVNAQAVHEKAEAASEKGYASRVAKSAQQPKHLTLEAATATAILDALELGSATKWRLPLPPRFAPAVTFYDHQSTEDTTMATKPKAKTAAPKTKGNATKKPAPSKAPSKAPSDGPRAGSAHATVWAMADALASKGKDVVRSAIIAAAVSKGINPSTASVGFAGWKKARGAA